MKKNIFTIILLLTTSFLFAQTNAILTEADQMPYFPGCIEFENGTEEKRNCSNQRLIAFISENLIYPKEAKEQGVEGTVLISFVVNKDGKVVQHKLIKDIGGGCGAAALKLLNVMPIWEAGKQDKQAVNVKLTLPLNYALKSGDGSDTTEKYAINWGQLRGQYVDRESLKKAVSETVIVRDELGNDLPISQLTIAYEKGKKYIFASSPGKITSEMQKVIKQVKAQGIFTIIANVQVEGEFVEVKRTFEVD